MSASTNSVGPEHRATPAASVKSTGAASGGAGNAGGTGGTGGTGGQRRHQQRAAPAAPAATGGTSGTGEHRRHRRSQRLIGVSSSGEVLAATGAPVDGGVLGAMLVTLGGIGMRLRRR